MLRARVLALAVAAAACSATAVAAEVARDALYAGQPLARALEVLRARGVKLIYSAELVTPEMRVVTEPSGTTLRELLDSLLSAHGLAAVDGPAGTLLIVRAQGRHGPSGSVIGTVLAEDGGRPFPGVELLLDGGGEPVWSSFDGSFAFEPVPAGDHTVRANAPGYVEAIADVSIAAGGDLVELEIVLIPRPRFLQEVTVTPSRYGLLDGRPESRTFLDREEVQRLPHLTDDIFRVAQLLPGVAAADLSAAFGIRGGHPDEVMIVLDGQQIYDPFHLHGFQRLFSVIDTELVERVDVLTGGFPVEWGDRLSGVVDVRAEVPVAPRKAFGASGFNARGILQGVWRDGAGSWSIAARRGYLDWLFKWLDTIDKGSDLVVYPRYWDLYATVRRPVGESGLLSGHLLALRDSYDAREEGDLLNAAGTTTTWYAWSTLWQGFGGGLDARTTLSASSGTRRLEGSSLPEATSITQVVDRRAFDVVALRQDWSVEQWRDHLLKWGAEVRSTRASYDHDADYLIRDPLFTADGPPLEIERHAHLRPSGWQYSLYLADRYRLAPGVTAEAGLRWDRQTWTPGQDQVSPRLNLVWETAHLGTLRAAWGRFAQSQGVHELQVADGLNEFAPAEWAEHRIFTWDRAFRSGYSLRAEVYQKVMTDLRPRFENLIEPVALFPEGKADRIAVTPERAVARGLEVVLKSPSDRRLSWWVGASLAAAEELVEGEWVPRGWDQRRAVTWSLNWRPGRHWNLNVSGLYHSGWPKTPHRVEFVPRADGTLELVTELGERNSARHPAYNRIDLRVSRTMRLGRGSLRLFLDIMNLTDHENARVKDKAVFSQSGGKYFVNYDDEEWVPILPTVGFSWQF